MGLYDTITCDYLLPPEFAVVQGEEFQTKDLDCCMHQYTLTCTGRLVFHRMRVEEVPEQERPYWGTPRWKDPLFQLCGCLRSIPIGDEDVQFHGDLVMCATRGCRSDGNWEWYEFRLRFTHGKLERMTRIPLWN